MTLPWAGAAGERLPEVEHYCKLRRGLEVASYSILPVMCLFITAQAIKILICLIIVQKISECYTKIVAG